MELLTKNATKSRLGRALARFSMLTGPSWTSVGWLLASSWVLLSFRIDFQVMFGPKLAGSSGSGRWPAAGGCPQWEGILGESSQFLIKRWVSVGPPRLTPSHRFASTAHAEPEGLLAGSPVGLAPPQPTSEPWGFVDSGLQRP